MLKKVKTAIRRNRLTRGLEKIRMVSVSTLNVNNCMALTLKSVRLAEAFFKQTMSNFSYGNNLSNYLIFYLTFISRNSPYMCLYVLRHISCTTGNGVKLELKIFG